MAANWFASADFVNTLVGIAFGFGSGFFFERRSSRATREQNRELEQELVRLKASVYSVGATSVPRQRERASLASLSEAVLERARSIQDPQGRLSQTSLTQHFFAQGFRCADIDHAIDEICASGSAQKEGKWLRLIG